MTAYARTAPPHIRTSESVPGMMWQTVAALLPAMLTAIFFFRMNALGLITISVLSAMLAEVAGRAVFNKHPTLYDANSVLTGLIFSLLLPPTTPVGMAAAGGFAAIFLGREMYGGLGANPFNPALLGLAFLHVGFPDAMGESPAMTETIPAAVLLAGGLFLMIRKLIRWGIPVLYLLILFFSLVLTGGNPAILSGSSALFAFFVITDPVTAPLTPAGRRLMAALSAGLAALLSRWSPLPAASIFSVLLANAANSWIDHWIRPSGSHRTKEALP